MSTDRDAERELLAAALRAASHQCQHDPCSTCLIISDEAFDAMLDVTAAHNGQATRIEGSPEAIVAVLLPVVDRIATERAAAALEAAAEDALHPGRGNQPFVPVSHLRRRAAALRVSNGEGGR